MLAWIRSPQGMAAAVAAAGAAALLTWFVPHALRPGVEAPSAPLPWQTAAAPQASPVAAAPQPAATSPGTGPSSLAALSPEAAKPAGLAPKEQAAPTVPSFDIVRVEPTGETVVAGRAEPDSDVALLDLGQVVAQARTDATGQFVFLPPRLAAGEHSLSLRATLKGAPSVVSVQAVAVSVAKAASAKPLVAVLSPDQPARVLSDGAASETGKVATASQAGSPTKIVPVAIQSVEAKPGGQLAASGLARAGSQCRLYLNGAFLADVTADKDGRWSVKVGKGMKPGRYTVRADEIEPSSGVVVNRAEVPFDYPVAVAAGEGRRLLGAKASAAPVKVASNGSVGGVPADPAGTVVASLNTARVARGDTLWRISRKMLGQGMQYTEIYASNSSQIRDPRLIYPGQIFVVPSRPAK